MQKILLAHAKAGMILARDVETAEGRILCGKETELSDSLLDRLARMEIASLTVEGHPVEEAGQKSLQEEIAAMERRFSKVTRIPPLTYLKKRLIHKLVLSRKQTKKEAATPSTAAAPHENKADSQ